MTALGILGVGIFMVLLRALFVICAIGLVLVVLIQKGRGGGLSGAFGGGGASNLLGSKTGDFLTWVTIGFVCFFLFIAVALAKWDKPALVAAPEEQGSQPTGQTTMPETTDTGTDSVEVNVPES